MGYPSPMTDPTNDDAGIAEFHAAAQRRKARILWIAGALLTSIGVLILLVVFVSDVPKDRNRFEAKTLILAFAFVAGGLVSVAKGFDIRAGRIKDIDDQ